MQPPPVLSGLELPVTAASVGPALRAVCHEVRLPLPGGGRTLARWQQLAEVSSADLTLGRLLEAHADALAIRAELGAATVPDDQLWGVWAAEARAARLTARRTDGRWRLSGRKAWCSGALVLDRALVTAATDDGPRLFAVETCDVRTVEGSWSAVGLSATGSLTVEVPDAKAEPVGGSGDYLDRAGFWHGGAGVAACWYGGALGAGRVLLAAARRRELDPHALAHLGAVDALLAGMAAHLAVAAAEIDADPYGGGARLRSGRLRARIEAGATDVLDRVGRALGPGPLCQDPVQAQRAADLPVYLRQSHAERDLAGLGALAAAEADW